MSAALVGYRAALATFDWQGEFIDDRRKRGLWQQSLYRLHDMQRELDPDGAIWLSVMPRDAAGKPQHGAPLPITTSVQEALSVITGSAA